MITTLLFKSIHTGLVSMQSQMVPLLTDTNLDIYREYYVSRVDLQVTMAVVAITNRKFFKFKDFKVMASTVLKYPILLEYLIKRITILRSQLNVTTKVFMYDFSKAGAKALSQMELRNLGGIYVLYSTVSGLFYVGSALSFWGKDGRLNSYFSKRLVGLSILRQSTKVSLDLAKDIQANGIDSFILIVPEFYPITSLTRDIVQFLEQSWMLLLPTFNRSLNARSNQNYFVPELRRQEMSNMVYIYELLHNVIMPDSLIIVYGLAEVVRLGITSMSGITHTISYNTLRGCYLTGKVWNDMFLFSPIAIDVATWRPDSDKIVSHIAPLAITDGRTTGIYVYEFGTTNLVEYCATVAALNTKYNISKTHSKHVRKYGYSFNGYLFSKSKLH